jgi:hypothetical protein
LRDIRIEKPKLIRVYFGKHRTSASFRALYIGRLKIADRSMNGRSLRCVAARNFTHLRQFWRCERAQQEFDTSVNGMNRLLSPVG